MLAVKESGLDMVRVLCMAMFNSGPHDGDRLRCNLCHQQDLWHRPQPGQLLVDIRRGNIAAVILIPFVGNLSDRIGRRPVYIVGILGAGILGYPYLYFVSQGNFPMALVTSIVMWGIVYQGCNAVFPSFFQELFPTRTRVTAFAVSYNLGIMATAFLPVLFAIAAPAGSNVPSSLEVSCSVARSSVRLLHSQLEKPSVFISMILVTGMHYLCPRSSTTESVERVSTSQSDRARYWWSADRLRSADHQMSRDGATEARARVMTPNSSVLVRRRARQFEPPDGLPRNHCRC